MNLLVTGAWQGFQDNKTAIERLGHKTAFLQWEKDPLPVDSAWVEGIIGNGIFLSHPIEQFVNLKYIQLTSAGYDRVPMDYVKSHGITIHNARGVYSIPMAEYAVGGVLSLYKRLPYFYKNQEKKHWEKARGLQELYGKTVLILGCGSVGTECAKRFAGFGCRVIGVDQYPREDENYREMSGPDRLDELLAKADVTVVTLPLTEETYHLLDERRLGLIKAEAILVNISRGAVVNQSALKAAVLDHRLGGAVLDVFEEEPLDENSGLWELPNVIITPHNSFVGEGNGERLTELILHYLGVKNAC